MSYQMLPTHLYGGKTASEEPKKKKKTSSGGGTRAAYQPAPALPLPEREADSTFRAPESFAPDSSYRDALAALEEISGRAPVYGGTYDPLVAGLFDRLQNRDPFAYDLTSDPLYLQYREQYTALGRNAMQDTVGQAAALTGGYGSTYAEAAGQQAYGSYLQQLNNRIPELYGLALDRYDREGNDLLTQFQAASTMADREYSAYRDAYRDWQTQQQAARGEADKAYDRSHQTWTEENKQKQQAFDNLVMLISKSGYDPSDAQLAYAGMTRTQAEALRQQYLRGLK